MGGDILPKDCAFIRRSGVEGLAALGLPAPEDPTCYEACPYASPTGARCEVPAGTTTSTELMGSPHNPGSIACLGLREIMDLWPDPADRKAFVLRMLEEGDA